MSDTPLLEIRDLTKTFGSVQALADVDFEVRSGEVMALVGDNGAGKSTLIKCVAGIHGYDSGEILFDGEPVTIHGPKDAAKLGIEVVYQDLALCDNLDVVQNMYLGREIRDLLFRLKEPAMEQRTAETLKGLRVTTIRSIRQAVATLSGGQRQSVAVARAVMWNSKLVILDEPTAALGVAQTEQVLALVNRLADQGLAVVLISHNLHDIFETATWCASESGIVRNTDAIGILRRSGVPGPARRTFRAWANPADVFYSTRGAGEMFRISGWRKEYRKRIRPDRYRWKEAWDLRLVRRRGRNDASAQSAKSQCPLTHPDHPLPRPLP